MPFFRILLIIIVIYLLLQLVARLVFGSVAKRTYKSSNAQRKNDSRREGEVTVDFKSGSKSKKIDRDEGEYISFEEVNDD